jgi:hypothetical protein
MLVVRKEQLRVLEEYSQGNFVREMVEHVKSTFPKHAASIGNDKVQEVVDLGIDRAARYGLTQRGPVRFYIEMMCIFGCDFDTDRQLPWAEAVLTNENIPTQMERADTLFDKMIEYDNVVTGPGKTNYRQALGRLNKISLDDGSLVGNFKTKVLTGLERIYPEKFSYIGVDGAERLIIEAKEIADDHSISSKNGIALFAALAFMLGHGFAHDPFFPWISKELEKEAAEPDERADRIQTKLKLYLDTALKK